MYPNDYHETAIHDPSGERTPPFSPYEYSDPFAKYYKEAPEPELSPAQYAEIGRYALPYPKTQPIAAPQPQMPRHPSMLWGREEREARWRRAGPAELRKEMSMWKPGAVPASLVEHATEFLAVLDAEHRAKYLDGKLT